MVVGIAERVHVVGSGPAGLSTALMLAQRGYRQISIYESRERPPTADDGAAWADTERSYNVGLNGRGQSALKRLGLMEKVTCISLLFIRLYILLYF